jgi:hypothetical protein
MIEQRIAGVSHTNVTLSRRALRAGAAPSKLPPENTLQAYPTVLRRDAQTGGLMLLWDWVGASWRTMRGGREWRRSGRVRRKHDGKRRGEVGL